MAPVICHVSINHTQANSSALQQLQRSSFDMDKRGKRRRLVLRPFELGFPFENRVPDDACNYKRLALYNAELSYKAEL
jgi:hypothetical protein